MKNYGKKISALIFLFAILTSIFLFGGKFENRGLGVEDISVANITQRQENCAFSSEKLDTGTAVSQNIKVNSRLWELFFGGESTTGTGELTLIPGGDVFGARIKRPNLTVENAKECKELKQGDIILQIDGHSVDSVGDVIDFLKSTDKTSVLCVIMRKGVKSEVRLPINCVDGQKNFGILLSDGAAGIGTVTFINPKTGEFGGLGHGICQKEDGSPISMTEGQVTGVILGGVQKGESGRPGELSGILTERVLGSIKSNTPYGVFGKFDEYNKNLKPMKVAKRDEVKSGDATIISTLKNGKKMEYKVKLCEIDNASKGTKCFKIKVEDPALIAISGGIVRGMSGSPIIQDGKLVGAVTHVTINDPTVGYGIFIENMIEHS